MGLIAKRVKLEFASSVTNPAMEPARVKLIKNFKDDGASSEANQAIQKIDRVDLVSSEINGHRHSINVQLMNGKLDFIVFYSNPPVRNTFDEPNMHTHQMMYDEENDGYILLPNDGHSHFLEFSKVRDFLRRVMRQKSNENITKHATANDMKDESFVSFLKSATLNGQEIKPLDIETKKMLSKSINTNGNDGESTPPVINKTNEDITMSDTPVDNKTKEELDALKAEVESLKAVKAVIDLPADQIEFYKSIETDEAKEEFLAKSDEDKAEAVKAASDEKANDIVVIEGAEFSKSDPKDAVVIKMHEDAKKSAEKALALEVSKAAEDNFGELPFTSEEKIALQKGIGTNEELTKKLKGLLKSDVFKAGRVSHSAPAVLPEAGDADELDKFVKEALAKTKSENPLMSERDAMIKVLGSAEYNEFISQ